MAPIHTVAFGIYVEMTSELSRSFGFSGPTSSVLRRLKFDHLGVSPSEQQLGWGAGLLVQLVEWHPFKMTGTTTISNFNVASNSSARVQAGCATCVTRHESTVILLENECREGRFVRTYPGLDG